MSASAYLICKILAVFLLLCMSKASGGTCLSYGHSCWGVLGFAVVKIQNPYFPVTAGSHYGVYYYIHDFPDSVNENQCLFSHGKRNGGTHLINPSSQKFTSGWYISKLLNPPPENVKNMASVYKDQNQDPEEVDNFHKYGYQLYPSTNAQKNTPRSEPEDVESKPNKWNSEINESENEVVVLTPDFESVPISKFRLLQMMNQEDSKIRSEK